MADIQTPADIAEAYIDNAEVRAALEDDIIAWYNWKIQGIKDVLKDVILHMGSPSTEVILDAIDNLEILEEEES
jgi:hypothetical protein